MALLDSLIIAALVLLWGWVLGKPLLVNRLGSRRRGGAGSFHRGLDALTRGQRLADGGAPQRYRNHLAARRSAARRRQVFLALVISVVVSLVLALALGDVFVTLNLMMDVLLAGFVGLAIFTGRQRVQRTAKVVPLRPTAMGLQAPYARASGQG
jgi:hypothetical protein